MPYGNPQFWRDMAILAAAWGMSIWAVIQMMDSESNGGATGYW